MPALWRIFSRTISPRPTPELPKSRRPAIRAPLTIIEALQDGRLSYSAEQKKVFYKDKAGKLIDAATGAPADGAEPADLADVRVNNRVRRALDAAVGGLSLQAADPAKRFESAQAVFKSREQSALPALDAALEKETDPRIKQALTEARAAVVLYSDDASRPTS